MTTGKTTQVADECCMLMNDYTPCKHQIVVRHAWDGVEITCKKCRGFTIYTSRDDVARIVGIFGRA